MVIYITRVAHLVKAIAFPSTPPSHSDLAHQPNLIATHMTEMHSTYAMPQNILGRQKSKDGKVEPF